MKEASLEFGLRQKPGFSDGFRSSEEPEVFWPEPSRRVRQWTLGHYPANHQGLGPAVPWEPRSEGVHWRRGSPRVSV